MTEWECESLSVWSSHSETSSDMQDDESSCCSTASYGRSLSDVFDLPSSGFSSPFSSPEDHPMAAACAIPSLASEASSLIGQAKAASSFEPDWHALLALPPLGEDWAVALDAVGIPDEPEDELDGSMLPAERLTALCSPASTQPGSVAPCPASGTAAGAARLRSPPARPDVVVIHSRQLTAGDSPVEITRERLAEHFHESLEVAAAKIGIGKSTMKLVCRRLGVEHWPYKHQGRRRSKAGCRGEASSSE